MVLMAYFSYMLAEVMTQNGRSVRLLILKSILNRELNIYLDHITELI